MKYAVCLLAASASIATLVPRAQAHINLVYPPSQMGSNQKGAAPCGGGGAAPVTTFKPGETIMVRWNETTPHPGHFRIAFDAEGTDDLKDPTSFTDIVDPPAGAVLADGVLKHTSGGGMRQFAVTLPNVTCSKCTLQLLQIMLGGQFEPGAGGSLYRRCANIVLAGAASGGDGGAPDGGMKGSGGAGGGAGGAGGSKADAGGSSGGAGGSSSGTGGSSPGNTGGSTGTGGSPVASSGGSSGGGTTSGGASGGAPKGGSTGSPSTATPSNADAGGCSVGGSNGSPAGWALIALVIGLALRSRRRR